MKQINKLLKSGLVCLSIISSGVVAIAVSACSNSTSVNSLWVKKYRPEIEKEIGLQTNLRPKLAITSDDKKSDIDDALQNAINKIVDKVISKDSKAKNVINVQTLDYDWKKVDSIDWTYQTDVAIWMESKDESNPIPSPYNFVPGFFSWKSTNPYFEWNSPDILFAIEHAAPNIFQNLEVEEPNYTDPNVIAKYIQQNSNFYLGWIIDSLVSQNKIYYKSSISFLKANLEIAKPGDVKVHPNKKNPTSGTLTLNISARTKSSKLKKYSIKNIPYHVQQ